MPRFIGEDENEYGPFEEEYVALLPHRVADLLIKNNRDMLLFTGILIVFPLAIHVILADLIMSLPPFIFLISKYRISKDRKYLLPAILIYLIPFIYLAKLVWLSSILYFFVVVLILRPANTTSRPSTIPRPNY